MVKKLVGKQSVDYVSRKTNLPVTGVSLHVVGEQSNVQGMAVETIFISTRSAMYEQCMQIPLNSDIEVAYNRFGSVDKVEICKTKQ